MRNYTKKQEESCVLHKEFFIFFCLESQKLLCPSCNTSKREALFSFPAELTSSFHFLSLHKKHENFYDFLVKNLINNRKFIMRIFLKEFTQENQPFFTKNTKKMLLFNHENLQKTLFFHKSPFFLLFEYHEFPLNLRESTIENPYFEEIVLFLLIKILDVFQYLHDKMGVFHGDFTEDSLRIAGENLKIIGVIWPFLDNCTVFMMKKKDLKDFGGFLQRILESSMYKKEGFLWKIVEKCEENDENLNVCHLKEFVEKFAMEFTGITDEFPNEFTKEFNGKLRLFGLKTENNGNSIDFYKDFKRNFSLNVNISANREFLDKEYEKIAINYMNLSQNVCFYDEIEALKIRVFPSKSLVNFDDKWRNFWFFSFFNYKKKQRSLKEIALTINSENDW